MYMEIVFASGGYRAHIRGGNHELVWWTEVYPRKQNAIDACHLVQRFAANATIYDRTG